MPTHPSLTLRIGLIFLLLSACATLSFAQETAAVQVVYANGEQKSLTLTEPSQMETVIRGFLLESLDGQIEITTRMESGRDEIILWAKKEAGKVSFTPDESQWITIDEALNRFRGGNASLHLSVCQRQLELLGEALDRWAEGHQGRPPERMEELIPEILGELPLCPTASGESYASTYKLSDTKRYTFYCPGDHQEIGVHLTFPAYDGVRGVYLP